MHVQLEVHCTGMHDVGCGGACMGNGSVHAVASTMQLRSMAFLTPSLSLRDESSQQLHRPARFLRLKSLAAEMQCQASTWHLVWCLYCSSGCTASGGSGPAGVGGPDVPAVGEKRTYRLQLADKVSSDPLLSRCGKVWTHLGCGYVGGGVRTGLIALS